MQSFLWAIPSCIARSAFTYFSQTLTCSEWTNRTRKWKFKTQSAIVSNRASEGVHCLIRTVVTSWTHCTICNFSSSRNVAICSWWANYCFSFSRALRTIIASFAKIVLKACWSSHISEISFRHWNTPCLIFSSKYCIVSSQGALILYWILAVVASRASMIRTVRLYSESFRAYISVGTYHT